MEHVNAATLVGLVGVTLVISVGTIFDSFREWLKTFQVRANPLRILGELMSCSMCAGWWVGFAWGLYNGSDVFEAVVYGGLVSICAYAADEGFAILAAGARLLVRGLRPTPPPGTMKRRALPPEEPMGETVPKTPSPDGDLRPLTEEEAHAYIGGPVGGE